ncbi:MAG TPA: hypothetical protein VGN98_11415, partial [Tianweitania sediminis]|nr:hypothetical protein [Tianweitania sediminis]
MQSSMRWLDPKDAALTAISEAEPTRPPNSIERRAILMPAQTLRLKKPLSIQTKLTVLVMTSLAVAMLTASLISMWHEADRFLRAKQETLRATAFVFGAAASAATARQDAHGVGQVLRGITNIPQIRFAQVSTVEGEQIAALGAAVRRSNDLDIGDISADPTLWALVMADTIAVTTPVIDGGKSVGNLTLVAESDLRSRIWAVLGFAFASSMIALVPSLLLTRRLQRSITRPLHQLARAMDDVAR